MRFKKGQPEIPIIVKMLSHPVEFGIGKPEHFVLDLELLKMISEFLEGEL